jgi:hypothetical protein
MWSYYGSKEGIKRIYPKPLHGKIIEPFAGTAKYALLYWDREVTIVDKYEVLIKIWKWLQVAAPSDINALPKIVPRGFKLDSIQFDCEEARLLFGFLIGKAAERPRLTAADRVTVARPTSIVFQIRKIIATMPKIKHWKIIHGSYLELGNEEATWFIDPPYQFGGHSYVESNRRLDFNQLAEWCRNRLGQIIVCENTKATWMDFKPIREQMGSLGITTEAIWTNHPVNYRKPQLKLF